jgi:serine/threonine-protein phosphatase 4 regulatory subunit 2
MKKMLIDKLDSFSAAPFTIQRICELLGEPRKQYSRIDKFMRAVEKNILVVSTQEPGRTRTESENGDSLNGDLSSEVNVDIDMDSENAFVVTTKDSSVTQTHGPDHELTTVTHETISLKKSSSVEGSKEEEEISVSVDTTITTVTKEDEKKDEESSEASQDSSNSSSSSSDETVTTCTTFSLSVETHKTVEPENEPAIEVQAPTIPMEEKEENSTVQEEPIKLEEVPIILAVENPEKLEDLIPEKLDEIPVDIKIDEPEVSIPPAETVNLPESETEELTLEQENELLEGVETKRLKIEEIEAGNTMKPVEIPEMSEDLVEEPKVEEPVNVEVVPEISLPSEIEEEAEVDLKEPQILLESAPAEWINELKESGVEIEVSF